MQCILWLDQRAYMGPEPKAEGAWSDTGRGGRSVYRTVWMLVLRILPSAMQRAVKGPVQKERETENMRRPHIAYARCAAYGRRQDAFGNVCRLCCFSPPPVAKTGSVRHILPGRWYPSHFIWSGRPAVSSEEPFLLIRKTKNALSALPDKAAWLLRSLRLTKPASVSETYPAEWCRTETAFESP